jgi:hypothetical protein
MCCSLDHIGILLELKVKIKYKLNLLYVLLYYAFNNHKRSHMVLITVKEVTW